MARVKGALNARKKHKKVLKLARGYRGARSKQYRVAKQSVMKAMAFAFAGRKQTKREYRSLWKQAQLGQQYRKELEDSLVRLGLTLDLGVAETVLRSIARTAAAEDLMQLKQGLEERVAQMLPVTVQLMGCEMGKEAVESGFLI